jgi:hypothetical protein
VTGRSGPHVAVYGAKRTHLSWLRWCSPYRRPNPRQAILFARESATPNESSGARRAREFSVGKAAAPHATRSSTVSTDATSLRSCPARERILSAVELNLVLVGALGSRPARAKPASDVAAKAEARDGGQDDVEAGEDGQRDRSVPPRRR